MAIDVAWLHEHAVTELAQYGAVGLGLGGGRAHGNHNYDKSIKIDVVTCAAAELV